MQAAPASRPSDAPFTRGSTMRHVVVMTGTGSVGLVAIFAVDALNLYYISLLGVEELAAAIGYASTLLFFTVSVAIGLTIACGALVARHLGQGDRPAAARMAGASLVFMFGCTLALTLATWPFLGTLAALMGATGRTLELTTRYLQLVLPSTPLLAVGMCCTGILRGLGDARRAMYVTLGSGVVAAVLDPVLILWLDMGLDGAAIATSGARLGMVAIGLHGAWRVHRLVSLPTMPQLREAARPFFGIGLPAVLTQIATPVGNAYVTVQIAAFGNEAVAGWAIIGRIVPVAFGVIFALSGAVGPILGQNYGAGLPGRLVSTLRDSLLFTLAYVTVVWALLALFAGPIADLFGATGLSRSLVAFFCVFAAGSFLFNGAIFVASAAFNNLGFPTYSTLFNWGRSTLGVVPFVWLGAKLWGAQGVIAGWGLGAVLFGIASVIVSFRVVRSIGALRHDPPDVPPPPPAADSPFSTGPAASIQP
jgi:putative MATE family efflux protein